MDEIAQIQTTTVSPEFLRGGPQKLSNFERTFFATKSTFTNSLFFRFERLYNECAKVSTFLIFNKKTSWKNSPLFLDVVKKSRDQSSKVNNWSLEKGDGGWCCVHIVYHKYFNSSFSDLQFIWWNEILVSCLGHWRESEECYDWLLTFQRHWVLLEGGIPRVLLTSLPNKPKYENI